MHDMLVQIIGKKRADLTSQKKKVPFEKLQESVKPENMPGIFTMSMTFPKQGEIAVIAEIKLASPTIKSLGSKEDVRDRARAYEKAGADAISFITEKHYFKGTPEMITKLKETVKIPILQKDFVIDPYQIYEAKKLGADALLLIAGLVDTETLVSFVTLSQEFGIEPVVEINSKEDLRKALSTTTEIIAVNARDLDTFEVSIDSACALLQNVSDQYTKLGFSGIQTANEVMKYKEAGADGVLIGTSLMQASDIEAFLGGLR